MTAPWPSPATSAPSHPPPSSLTPWHVILAHPHPHPPPPILLPAQVGTYLIALAAKAQGVPAYAVAATSKFSPGPVADLAHPGDQPMVELQEEKGAQEVTAAWQVALEPG